MYRGSDRGSDRRSGRGTNSPFPVDRAARGYVPGETIISIMTAIIIITAITCLRAAGEASDEWVRLRPPDLRGPGCDARNHRSWAATDQRIGSLRGLEGDWKNEKGARCDGEPATPCTVQDKGALEIKHEPPWQLEAEEESERARKRIVAERMPASLLALRD